MANNFVLCSYWKISKPFWNMLKLQGIYIIHKNAKRVGHKYLRTAFDTVPTIPLHTFLKELLGGHVSVSSLGSHMCPQPQRLVLNLNSSVSISFREGS
jgi:hypothetical protein